MKVSDFLPLYPDTNDPLFIQKLSSLKEFSMLKLSKEAGELPTATRNKSDVESTLLTDQIFFRRLFNQSTPYGSSKGFLINKEPGTGKTCSASAIIENFKMSEIDETKFLPAIVLVPNNEMIAKFRSEVTNRCTKEYEIDGAEHLQDHILRRRIKKSLQKTYEIHTHHTFLKKLKTLPDARIAALYSSRRIFVDESHAFRYYDLTDDVDAADIDLEDNSDKTKTIEKWKAKNELYLALQRLIDTISNSQIFLMTGTPMTNSVTEIAGQLNLILPPSDRFPTGKKFEDRYFDKNNRFKENMIPEFLNKLIGKVSFLREPFVKKTYIGQKAAPWVKLSNVVMLEMSEHQSQTVDGMMTDRRGFDRKPMSASISLNKPTRDNLKSLAEFSVKFEYLRNLIESAEEKGECIWIACDFVSSETTGSLTTLSALLELLGYTRASTPDIIKSEGKHYIRIDQESRDLDDLLKVHNRSENRYGTYNRIIIGGPKAKLGFSLSHIRHDVKLNPDWHKADENQYLARAIRHGSLNALPVEERYTNIHLLCAVKPGFLNAVRSGEKLDVDKWETIDLHMFQVSETKEEKISQIKRLLKRVAVDCAVNYNRNYRKGDDVDGSKECEYTTCEYNCYLPNNPKGMDPNSIQIDMPLEPGGDINYTILHSTKEMTMLMMKIRDIFTKTFNISFEKLRRILRPSNDTILLLALDEFISGRIKCKNRYGFDNYLHEQNNYYYLSDKFEAGVYGDYFNVKYPIILSQTETPTLLNGLENHEDTKLLATAKFIRQPSEIEFEKLSFGSRIALIENTIAANQRKEYSSNPPPSVAFILEYAKKHVSFDGIELEIPLGQVRSSSDDIGIYHRMWYEEQRQFQVIKSGKENPKLESHGLTREFRNGKWSYLPIAIEKRLVEHLNSFREGRKPKTATVGKGRGRKAKSPKRGGETNEPAYRVSRVNGILKVFQRKSAGGMECSSMSVEKLHTIIKEINSYYKYPDRDTVVHSRDELIDIIKENKPAFTLEELEEMDDDTLVDVYQYQNNVTNARGTPKKEMLCAYLEKIAPSN